MVMPSKNLIPPEEENFLAMCISGGHAAVAQAALLVQPNQFATKVHQDIFKNLCLLWDAGRSIDWRSVSEGLDATPYREVFKDDSTGPKRYVSDLSTAYPYEPSALPHFAEKIIDAYERRQLIEVAGRLAADARDMEKDLFSIKGDAVERLLLSANDKQQLSSMAGEVLDSGLETEILAFLEDPRAINGIRTGVHAFDNGLGGLERRRVYTCLADTSIGKSFHTHWLARQCAIHGHTPLIFSTEMPKPEVVQRLAFMEGGLDRLEIRKEGYSTPEEKAAMSIGLDLVHKSPIAVCYAASMDISVMASEIRRRQMVSGVDVVFVDHIQGLRAEGIPMSKERELINAVTSGIKQIAGELDVPIVQISHIHRPGDETSLSRPTIRQAHGSGSIERDSDVVYSIYPVRITMRADGSWRSEDFTSRTEFLEQQKTGKVAMELMVQKSRGGGSPREVYWMNYRRGGQWFPLEQRNG